ncbi:hypothetical protein [Paenarthrobacter sp. PH39-S1]|uniref:hypothetical protein n=1 Tax=Paenarthrobacter sp. PH39-S1 TaxID=3046204 RepID=UPI0024BA2CD9|nr:hypothetical protein [Paenarthrobacter sp. PH39-S1]MDJ0356634.1 hypothetical protein [Paenarthrobacter sp. PH39-S1]
MTAVPDARMPVRPEAPGFLHVVAENPVALQNELDRAVEQVRVTAAAGERCGILIARRSRSLFTVEASADVPYGTTLEQDRWHRPARTPPTAAGDEAAR